MENYTHLFTEYEKQELEKYTNTSLYYLGENGTKSEATSQSYNNYGFDDSKQKLYIKEGDHIDYRYEIVKKLGKGRESTVVKAIDHKDGTEVALKVIRSKAYFVEAAEDEIALLEKLNEQDPDEEYGIDKTLRSFKWRKHYIIVQQLMQCNLKTYMSELQDDPEKEDKLR